VAKREAGRACRSRSPPILCWFAHAPRGAIRAATRPTCRHRNRYRRIVLGTVHATAAAPQEAPPRIDAPHSPATCRARGRATTPSSGRATTPSSQGTIAARFFGSSRTAGNAHGDHTPGEGVAPDHRPCEGKHGRYLDDEHRFSVHPSAILDVQRYRPTQGHLVLGGLLMRARAVLGWAASWRPATMCEALLARKRPML